MNLLEILKRIKSKGPADPSLDIDYSVEVFSEKETADCNVEAFLDLAEKWPKFSGNRGYPVPNPYGDCPACAFKDALSHEMWNKGHLYSVLRHELLDWCIEQLEALQDES